MTNKKQEPINFKKAALVSALLLELAGTASAATITVDGTTCTLNDAITAANNDTATGGCDAGAGADILELPMDGMLNLSTTAGITSIITINGNNSTIQPDPSGNPFPLIDLPDGGNGDLTLNDSNLINGYNYNGAGAIDATNATLNINRSTFSNNTGGAIRILVSTGSVNDSVIDGNPGLGGPYYGGGLSIASSTVTVSNTTISNNSNISTVDGGGGLVITDYNSPTEVSLINTTISGNTSNNGGGGIFHYNFGNGTVINLTNVTLAANTSNATGGGMYNRTATINISQSLISGNTATAGPEINSDGGIITVDDYNLFGLNGDAGVVGVTVGASDIVPTATVITDIVDVNLEDNGGPTPTHALAMGSPAIDAVPAASCASMTDQTGKARPQDGDDDMIADCDIGAFENADPALDLIFANGFESP